MADNLKCSSSLWASCLCVCLGSLAAAATPNIVLVMADDQGWGETGYYQHPVLQTPELDEMSRHGLRFDRFYAAAPVCSPTRASVLTGRSNRRTGVESHGYALRRQEKTIAQALQQQGYATGHFGKWHLDGLRGPGVPILASDTHHPGIFGFDEWLSVTNFFDRNPILSRQGEFLEFQGDSSEIIVEQAVEFIARQATAGRPSFTVIWYGSPHSPFVASAADRASFSHLDRDSQNHYAEIVAMDRSLGQLRRALRRLEIADNTLVWFCSDNGGLPKITPGTVGPLRGFKGSLYEGGLRVPAMVEWPAEIESARVTNFPASTMDIFPTLADIVGLPDAARLSPQDGISLRPRFTAKSDPRRERPIPFNTFGETALIDNQFKLLEVGRRENQPQAFELYDLEQDPSESRNLIEELPDVAQRLRQAMQAWQTSLAASLAGLDYPEQAVFSDEPPPRRWSDLEDYRSYFPQWKLRPEYQQELRRKQ